jgi:hypothetical protein
VIVDASNRCIEYLDVIDRILAHLQRMEQETPTPPTTNATNRGATRHAGSFRWEGRAVAEIGHTSLDQRGRH